MSKAAGLFALLRQPLHALSNAVISTEEIAGSTLQELHERLFEAKRDHDKITMLDRFFLQTFATADPPDRLTEAALQAILDRRGNLRIDNLTNFLGVHYKTLERRFQSYAGEPIRVYLLYDLSRRVRVGMKFG